MRKTAITLCLMLGACVGGSRESLEAAKASAQPVQLSDAERSEVEQGVRQGLKDPNSAMFGTMSAVVNREVADTYTICGYVNSKNSFGGYVGNTPFLAFYDTRLKAAQLIGVGGTDVETYAVQLRCGHYGISI